MKICYNCFHELPDTARVCPNCGQTADISNEVHYPHALPCGSVLAGRYIIGRVLGQGGFGITYLAQEYESKKLVAIKEYYPDAMAIRGASSSVVPYNHERAANFEYGKERFIDEAKTLAEFIGNPNIVRVNSYFEENGTAYFVMEYVNGISLKKYLKRKGGKLSWEEALWVLAPVMDALSAVHEKGIIHRDVTPDNIVITDGGNTVTGGGTDGRNTVTGTASVKLLDFGAARYSIGERSQSLDIILKQGFAPCEQYIHRSRQGAFTDEYSLAATLYYSITGAIPQEAVERMGEDHLESPRSLGVDIPPAAEAALMKALSVRSEDRFRTMGEFKKALLDGSLEYKSIPDGTLKDAFTSEDNLKNVSAPGTQQRQTSTAGDISAGTSAGTREKAGKEIILTKGDTGEGTEHSGNTGKDAGGASSPKSRSIPKWAIPLVAVLTAIAIFFAIKDRGAGSGQNAPSGAAGSRTASDSGAGTGSENDKKISEGTGEQLSPYMQELLAKANAGDIEARYTLAKDYYSGNGIDQNYDEALAWYTKAAEQGSTDAQYDLAEMYHSGTGTQKDDEKAYKWYREAADKGHSSAQCRVGVMLQTGEGTEKNEEEALVWFQKAADQEDPEGEYCLGMVYLNDTDYAKAIELFTKAAEQDFAEGQLCLGKLYMDGTGVKKDYKKAFEWIKKAGDQGLAEAQYYVALMYEIGYGIEQDPEEARKWYELSAGQGYEAAVKRLENGDSYEDLPEAQPGDIFDPEDVIYGEWVDMP